MNEEQIITEYLMQVEKFLPYKLEKRREIIKGVQLDFLETIRETEEKNPVKVFGEPIEAARNISMGQEWETKKVGFAIRALAYIVDFILSLIFIFSIIMIIFATSQRISVPDNSWLVLPVIIVYGGLFLSILLAFFGWAMVFEGYFSTSPGKFLIGLAIVDEFGTKITWKQAIVRSLSKLQLIFLVLDVVIGIIMKTDHQRAFDLIARTYVIKVK